MKLTKFIYWFFSIIPLEVKCAIVAAASIIIVGYGIGNIFSCPDVAVFCYCGPHK